LLTDKETHWDCFRAHPANSCRALHNRSQVCVNSLSYIVLCVHSRPPCVC